jgi:hypothetical protein
MTTEYLQIPKTAYSAIDPADDITQSFEVINNKLKTVESYSAGETISTGSFVAINSSGLVVKALAGDLSRTPVIGVALEDLSVGSGAGLIQTKGIYNLPVYEMTVGVPQGISQTVAGQLADTASDMAFGSANMVGFSLTKSKLLMVL